MLKSASSPPLQGQRSTTAAAAPPRVNDATEDGPAVVVAEPLPLPASRRPREGFWRRVLQQLVETANPNTMHTEELTPAERQKQASFESFDYYKSYPAMYLTYLRHKKRERGAANSPTSASAAAPAASHQHADDSNDTFAFDSVCSLTALQPSPAVASSTGSDGGHVWDGVFSGGAMPRIPISLPRDDEERHTPLRWFLHVLIALSVGVVATVVSYAVEIIENYRADTLSRVIGGASFRIVGYAAGFLVWNLMSLALVAVATGVVVYFEPAASGGGIPDVMAYLNGVHMRKAMNIKTFIAKAISCVCAVAGGLPVGLEAPLIHLGAITGAGVTQGRSRSLGFQTSFFRAFRNNKDRRDFITAGAACGVSAAFGAPIGGLLFVMEEVSSFWDHSASGQIFLATMVCFTVTTIINSLVEDNRLLGWVSNTASVLFEVNLTIPLNLISIVPSLFLGAILGGLAALFTKVNLVMIAWRRRVLRPYPLRRFLEPVVVAAVYGSLMYTLTLLSDCRALKDIEDVNETIHVWGTEKPGRLFNDTCRVAGEYSPLGTLNMATGKNTIRHLFTRQTVGEFPVYYLLIHFVIYFASACVCSGMALSGGLVVPSLVIGAIFGRLYGLLLWYVGANRGIDGIARSYRVTDAWMDPGVFALIGAGAFLAGTSRMAMSICVIMVELSSELHYLLPVMVAIVMAKTVADWLCEPLYHQMLHLDSVPYLGANLLLTEFEQLTAADVMAAPVVVLRRRERTEVVLAALRDTTHHAFPVVVDVAGEGQGGAHSARHGQREDGHTTGGGSSPSRIRGLDSTGAFPSSCTAAGTHQKFVGLVTREDLQVYLTLPQLQQYDPSAEAALPAAGPDGDDGFGGRLARCVADINRMIWQQWLVHKASLFFSSGERYDWVRSHVPVARAPASATMTTTTTTTPAAAAVGGDRAADEAAATRAKLGADGGDGAEAPLLPPVLDLTVIINRSPWVITPSFNLQLAYHTFRTMGLRHMVVVDGDVVTGIITRKDLLVDALRSRMKELRARLEHRAGAAVADDGSNGGGGGGGGGGAAAASRATGAGAADPLRDLFPTGPGRVRGPGIARPGQASSASLQQQRSSPAHLLWD